ncbi:MAG: hypothetical protein L0H63_13380 [Nitrococcus sp.]|nr:hypothetical protein [Nitrococcus sp.]
MELWMLIVGVVIVAMLLVFYVWYQNRRSRESFKKIDYRKVKDLSKDGWEDE